MTQLPVVPRELALRDIETAVQQYAAEAGAAVAIDFIDAIESARSLIAAHPQAGSLRYAYELGLPGLRCWPTAPFPWLMFYVARTDHVDLWRVLHAHADLPSWLAGEAYS